MESLQLVLEIANRVNGTASKVEINRHQCSRLAKVFDEVGKSIKLLIVANEDAGQQSAEIDALDALLHVFESGELLVLEYAGPNWFRNLMLSQDNKEAFEEVYDDLRDIMDYTFGIPFDKMYYPLSDDAAQDQQEMVEKLYGIKSQQSIMVGTSTANFETSSELEIQSYSLDIALTKLNQGRAAPVKIVPFAYYRDHNYDEAEIIPKTKRRTSHFSLSSCVLATIIQILNILFCRGDNPFLGLEDLEYASLTYLSAPAVVGDDIRCEEPPFEADGVGTRDEESEIEVVDLSIEPGEAASMQAAIMQAEFMQAEIIPKRKKWPDFCGHPRGVIHHRRSARRYEGDGAIGITEQIEVGLGMSLCPSEADDVGSGSEESEFEADDLRIEPSKIKFGKKLGAGGYSEVRVAEWVDCEFAVKILKAPDVMALRNEVGIHIKLRHPHIVLLVGFSEDKDKCMILMELMEGDLHTHIASQLKDTSRKPPFSLHEAVGLMKQIAVGMEFLHLKGILHGDLKTQNVLFKRNRDGLELKITDFGVSKEKLVKTLRGVYKASGFSGMKGSGWYRAPEILESTILKTEAKYSGKADVYSFAMTAYEILTGLAPFHNKSPTFQSVVDGDRPELPPQLNLTLKQLVERCWHGDQDVRPSFKEICTDLKSLAMSPEADMRKQQRGFFMRPRAKAK